MDTVASNRPAWELPHSLGSIFWREDRTAYVVAVRERKHRAPVQTYVKGSRTEATYREAELELARRVIRLEDHDLRHVGKVLTVGAWLDAWLPRQAQLSGYPVGDRKASGSYAAYESRINLYIRPVLGDVRLAALDADTITDAFVELGELEGSRGELLSPGTVNAAWVTLRAALKSAHDAGKLKRDVTRGVKVATSTTLIEPPSIEELDRLDVALVGDPWRAAFAIMRETGARRGEVLGLEWRGVDLEAGTIAFKRQRRQGERVDLKSKRPRRVAIPAYVVELLEAIPAADRLRSPLVFSTSSGRAVDGRNLLRHFRSACERAGIAPDVDADLDAYRVHDLRHSFATTLLEAGVATGVVAAWLGHASLRMMDRYNDVHPIRGGAAYRRLVEVWGHDAERAFGLRVAA